MAQILQILPFGFGLGIEAAAFGEGVVLGICPGQGVFPADRSRVFENGKLRVAQESLQQHFPIVHVDVFAPLRAELGLVQEHDRYAIERVYFLGIEVVLRRADIALDHVAAFP